MVDLSLAVGAEVIAERIETEDEAAAMRALGVHHGQGWLFGRPGSL
jgi:EAL domain-containing protein (putative c-di-GMP-specific phosphodiesterase class I)